MPVFYDERKLCCIGVFLQRFLFGNFFLTKKMRSGKIKVKHLVKKKRGNEIQAREENICRFWNREA